MFAHLKRTVMALALLGAVSSASAYSLGGIYDTWQTSDIGYQQSNEILGPMNQFVGEEYRWNIPNIYYGFDISFLDFFGAPGTNAIHSAVAVLNAIPQASLISSNLAEYPLDTKRINYRASALNLLDLKSSTLSALVEQMGLASPERFVWTLRARVELTTPPRTNYTVIKRNYDPVTRDISSYVNGVLYTYVIQDANGVADAVEVQVDPLQIGFTSVASVGGQPDSLLGTGAYFTGLTRDDIGGWKRLYESSTLNIQNHVENLPPSVTNDIASSPWVPVGGTNSFTNSPAATNAIRTGVDKINFLYGNYDSYLGTFVVPITNKWTDFYRSNASAAVTSQKVQRALTQPDILFTAEDLGVDANGVPILFKRSDTSSWVNNNTINGKSTTAAGPGVIQGAENAQVVFTYNPVGPYFVNQDPFLLDETRFLQAGISWGSFDGTTNPPIVYPTWSSVAQLQLQATFSGPSPWVPVANSQTNNSSIGGGGIGQ